MMTEKLEMMSKDLTQKNVKKIQQLFPNCVTEVKDKDGKVKLAVDFDVLKQELSSIIIDDKQERYQMTWPDKKKSILLANSRITGTLRPDIVKSVNFDTTKNLYIEGDNLDVLKVLRETYLNKVKVIYIDPPYNTGNDFVYEDDFSQSSDNYLKNSGQFDEQGNRLFANNESNGRFHTDWLNMMYPRLKIAKDFLTDDGAIFISIDDNELENLLKLCNEIFGQKNYVGTFSWMKTTNPPSLGSKIRDNLEYVICYEKNFNTNNKLYGRESNQADSPLANASNKLSTVTIPKNSCFFPNLLEGTIIKGKKDSDIILIDNIEVREHKNNNDFNITFHSKWNQENINFEIQHGTSFIIKDSQYFSIRYIKGNIDYVVPDKYLDSTKFYVKDNEYGRKEVESLLGKVGFNYPKNTPLIQTLINMYTHNDKDGVILDFFSGSATTAHAVIQLNAEDGGNRKFIMVQLPEKCDSKSEGYKAGYSTICEIGEERIRRAGQKIREEWEKEHQNEGLFAGEIEQFPVDIGFRVLKLDSSNMNDVYYNPNSMNQTLLDSTIDNVKPGRTGLDLLFQVMLELGVELSAKIEKKTISGKQCFVVNENDIVACFDDTITDEVTRELAKIKPIYAVFKDSSFDSDSSNINCEQIFKSVSPTTTIKVI